MPQTQSRLARPPRFSGLDGLRAIAVALVLGYHLFPEALPGGFLGVDVFFVISGFLITSLMLREHSSTGSIRLLSFWRRRARRLLPALGLVLAVSTALALTLRGDLLVSIGRQIAGAAFFVSNWVFIASGTDYFARDTPELFRNTWSLSIEEQFYIVLPLLLLVLLRMRGTFTRALPLLLLGGASALLMLELSQENVDPTRIYFGSDTHTFGLLLGAAMATLLHRAQAPVLSTAQTPPPAGSLEQRPLPVTQVWWTIVGVAGLAALGWLSLTTVEGSQASFQGGFQLATVATLATVWAVTRPGAWIGAALDAPPLRWLGERSYGIYLWHWPLLLIWSAALGPKAGWVTAILTLVSTLTVAALSYRYIEQPVRRFGLRHSLQQFVRVRNSTPRRLAVTAALGTVLAVSIPATIVAVASAPPQSSAADAVARGQQALDRSTEDSETEASNAGSETGVEQTGVEPRGDELSAVGDSVMLASLPELEQAYPGIKVDAAVSRSMGSGVGIVSELAATDELGRVLVVGLGTNGPVNVDDLASIHQYAGDRPLVLINAHADRDWVPGVNQRLTDFADSYRGVVVADWDGAVTGVDGALAGDDIHPNPSGGTIYAAAVARALEELQEPGEALGYALARR